MLDAQTKAVKDLVVGHYVSRPGLIASLLSTFGSQNVKPMNGGFQGTCPLHNGDNQKAFAVWHDHGGVVWKCFTKCHASGDIFELIKRKYGVNFKTSIGIASQYAGLNLQDGEFRVTPEMIEQQEEEEFNRRIRALKRHSSKVVFPQQMLNDSYQWLRSEVGIKALDYLVRERSFPSWVIDRFCLGYVPGKVWLWDNPDGSKTGWSVDRVTVPLFNDKLQIVGFAGRRLDGRRNNKYQFLKGTDRNGLIFGLHDKESKRIISETGNLVLVEGQLDVLRCWSHGLLNAGAVGGTELTPTQINQLAALPIRNIVLYGDNDEAGILAIEQQEKQLRSIARVIKVLPEAGDPGEILDKNEFWQPLLNTNVFT